MTMTAHPAAPPPDSYDAAEAALIADVRRFGQIHVIEGWGLLGDGTRYLLCSCTHTVRTEGVFWSHIIEDLAKERGPVDKKKR